jgi:hypothetical protein
VEPEICTVGPTDVVMDGKGKKVNEEEMKSIKINLRYFFLLSLYTLYYAVQVVVCK